MDVLIHWVVDVILGNDSIYFIDDTIECNVYIRAVQCRRLDECELVLIRILCRILFPHLTSILQVGLVSHEEYDDIRVSKLLQLSEPLSHVLETLCIGRVIDKKRTNRSSIIS